MDKRQYYLQKIAEEALEVATAAMKCIQFGNDSLNPSDPESLRNIDQLLYEVVDFEGALAAAKYQGFLKGSSFNHYINKVRKIDGYYDLCVKLGTVKED